MEKIKIKIGNKEYNVTLSESDEEKEVGLQNITKLPQDEGMLFVFDEPDEISFWMKDTLIPLDVVFIDENMTVIAVHKGVPNTEDYMTEANTLFVLEVNQDSGIQSGDELEFSPEKEINKNKMHVLDANGNTQMELDGGERIFSRNHTKILIKFAKKAATTQNDNDYKTLGKRVFKFLQTQTETAPEYVKQKINN